MQNKERGCTTSPGSVLGNINEIGGVIPLRLYSQITFEWIDQMCILNNGMDTDAHVRSFLNVP